MKKANILHDRAMELADEGFIAKIRGDKKTAVRLFKEALEKEKASAFLVVDDSNFEPTRSVLLRSAASLALECDDLREAERLISKALSGDPPDDIAEELRDLLEQVFFGRHLKLRGIELQPDEFQFVLSGKVVGPGFVETIYATERVRHVETLVQRTFERKLQQPYREGGRRKQRLTLYQSLPRAASFALTFRIAEHHQTVLPGAGLGEGVIDEIFECFSLLNNNEIERLNKRISDDSYYRNFMSLARGISPDGKDIRTVGMTIIREGREKSLLLERTKDIIPIIEIQVTETTPKDEVELIGLLKFADATDAEKGIIKVIDDNGRTHKIKVLPGMMSDIVRPMFDYRVRITGRKNKKLIVLDTIDRIEDVND